MIENSTPAGELNKSTKLKTEIKEIKVSMKSESTSTLTEMKEIKVKATEMNTMTSKAL